MEAQFRKIVSGEDSRLAARLVRPMLGAVTEPYRLAVAARNRLYDAGVLRAHRVAIPVVSIGNLTLGGTGKTPLVEFVCRWFLDRSKRPVILSRGYRVAGVESSSPHQSISPNPIWKRRRLEASTSATQSSTVHNDEALLLRANLPDVPHLQGKDRVALGRRAIEELRPDVLVLDDGFQHRRLARDLDIVLVDCTEPFGYGHIFPRGLLREPVSSLARADLVVLSRPNLVTRLNLDRIRQQIILSAGDKPTVLAEQRPTVLRSITGENSPIESLAGKSVAAFCGIGNPEAFWKTLRGLGCNLVATLAFPDHHAYTPADLSHLKALFQPTKPEVIVCTQKDLVKIAPLEPHLFPLYSLQIEAVVTDAEGHLDAALQQALQAAAGLATAA